MRTSIILGGLALTLLAFIMLFERGSLSTREREGRKGKLLESFVRERVTRIELQRKGVTTVLVRGSVDPNAEPDQAGFRVERPYQAAADRDAVDSLLGALEWITPRRSLGEASKADLAKFGFDKPRYRLTFEAGRTRRSFSIGAPSSDAAGAYLFTPEDGRAYVVGKDLVEALDHEPTDFHTKQLLAHGVTPYGVEKLRLQDARGETLIEKRAELLWLASAEPVLASEPALGEIVNALDALKAARFIADKPTDLASYGLEPASFSLSLDSHAWADTQKDKAKLDHLEFRTGAACAGHAGESYVQVDRGPVMCAADVELQKLQKPREQLRETRLLVLEDAAIRSVELRAGTRKLRVEEQGETHTFRVTQDGRELQSGSADETALSDWLKALRGLTAESFAAEAAVALGNPVSVLEFARGKDKPAYLIEIGRSEGERVAVRRAGEKLVAWYPKRILEAVSISGVRFRKARVLDEQPASFASLTLRAAGRPNERVTKSGDRYQLEQPIAGSPAERSDVDELVRLVSKLEVVRFVADQPAAEHKLNEPAYTLAIEYQTEAGKPAPSHNLRVGASSDDGRYAQLDADPAVFVLSPALVRQLDTPLVSRAALAVPLEELGSFTIAQGGSSLRVEATADGGHSAVGATPDPKRGDALARAVGTLRASRALGYGKPQPHEGMDKPQLRVTIQLRGSVAGQERTLLFGNAVSAEPTADVYARRTDLDVLFSVPRNALDSLRPNPK